jgi:gas vesicle protein
MATLAYLDRNIWAKGELTEPKLNLVFSPATGSTLTVVLALYDYNGVKVTDDYSTTIPAGTPSKTIVLGDYLDAQQTAKGFGSGFYVIIVKITETNEVFALPLIVTLGYITPPAIPDSQYLQYYTVFDRVIGTYLNLPPTISYIPSDPRFWVYAYLHKENKGRLIGLSETGSIVFDTDYHQLALITLTLKFNSIDEMITHMLAHSYGLTASVVLNAMDAINRGDYDTALKLLRPYYMITFLGRMITAEFDTANYEIRIKTQVYLGQWDWGKIFSWGAIGCGVSVLGAVVITAVTAGVGAITAPLVAGACLAGGAIGAGLAVITSTSSDKPETTTVYVTKIVEEGEKAKQQNQQYYNDAKSILDTWLQQGKITQDDYNQMMNALNTWKTGMDSAIDDIVKLSEEMIKKAYDDGYKKGVSESKAWIIGAGAGGLLLGFLLGRR